MGCAAVAERGYRVHVIVKEIKGKAGQHVADRMREAHGVVPLPRRGSVKRILRLLRQNTPIGFVLDQNMTREEGVFVDFFGHEACTMPGLAVLAQRAGSPVVPVTFWRDDSYRINARFLPPLTWQEISSDRGENVRHNTQRYTHAIEDMIRSHPAQWLWFHRRWKTRPPGDSSP